MPSRAEILEMLTKFESDRGERTTSIREDKFGPAVCALSNDFPNHNQPGYILLGVNDDGSLAGMKIGDKGLQQLGNVRDSGKVLPQPSMVVGGVHAFPEGDVVVIEVSPSSFPPVRYKGKCWIQVGPRRAVANPAEERRLTEKRASLAKTFAAQPFRHATLSDLDLNAF